MNRLLSTLLLLTVSLLPMACDTDPASPTPPDVPETTHALYIVNEGNFQRNNAELSIFMPDSGRVYNNIFKSLNDFDLGDTGNSITLRDGRAYIVVNGSNKVEILDTKTKLRVGSIQCPAGSSPRHVVFDAHGRACISNLYSNSISVYDLATSVFVHTIPVGNNPEQMLIDGTTLLVANSGFGAGRTVSVVNLETATVVKELHVSDNPMFIERLGTTRALVLCCGAYNDFTDPNDDTPGMLFTVDLTRMVLIDSMVIAGHPQRLTVDGAGHVYTVGSGGIMRIDLATGTSEPDFIPGWYYSVLCDPDRGVIYVTDPLDYVQPGRLLVFSLSGEKRAEYPVGVIPGAMTIDRH